MATFIETICQGDPILVNIDRIGFACPWRGEYTELSFCYAPNEDESDFIIVEEPYKKIIRKIRSATSKKEKENIPPTPPIREKENERENTTPRARTRVKFEKPTVKEVAAHIAEKGYTFDAEEFWNFYESKGWRVGSHVMKSWMSACVTWQKKREREERNEAARTAHIDAKMDERAEKRQAHIDAKMDERAAKRLRSSNYVESTKEQFKKEMEGEQ